MGLTDCHSKKETLLRVRHPCVAVAPSTLLAAADRDIAFLVGACR